MKKTTKIMIIAVFVVISLFAGTFITTDNNIISNVYAATASKKSEDTNETLKGESTGQLLELKKHEEATVENLTEQYGSKTYGMTAYILDRVRIYSIPCVFIGIAINGIYQYVIGLKRLDLRQKGFNGMIAIITVGIICQILPIVFAIVITRQGN